MTAVFVHGNPETAAVWRPLLVELGRVDAVTLSPPGFGTPIPEGFGSTADEYLAWLMAEVEGIGLPVDLVGHDWGSNHVIRLACARPDLLRSWCCDTAGVFAPGYVWHKASEIFMTPVAGEHAIAAQLDMGAAARTSLYESLGMTPGIAKELAEAFDESMGNSILSVYRSAQPAWDEWRECLPAASARPGLVLAPEGDSYTGGEARHRWAAKRMGARVAVLPEVGHWWMLQEPKLGAETLVQFWSSFD